MRTREPTWSIGAGLTFGQIGMSSLSSLTSLATLGPGASAFLEHQRGPRSFLVLDLSGTYQSSQFESGSTGNTRQRSLAADIGLRYLLTRAGCGGGRLGARVGERFTLGLGEHHLERTFFSVSWTITMEPGRLGRVGRRAEAGTRTVRAYFDAGPLRVLRAEQVRLRQYEQRHLVGLRRRASAGPAPRACLAF